MLKILFSQHDSKGIGWTVENRTILLSLDRIIHFFPPAIVGHLVIRLCIGHWKVGRV